MTTKKNAAVNLKAGTVSLTLSVKTHGLGPILGAAYLLSDRAYARLDGDRTRALTVTLKPKQPLAAAAGLRALAAEFEAELESQKVRWAVAENNAAVREHILRQAVLVANGRAPAPPAAAAGPVGSSGGGTELTPEQQAEVDRLIAEVEVEIKELKAKPAGADPDNVKATWEETHGEKG